MEVWQYPPQGDLIESLEWATDIVSCKLVEYRYSQRYFPRQTFAYEYQLTEAEYNDAREKARRIGGAELYIPDWPRRRELPSLLVGTTVIPVDTTYASSYHNAGKLLLIESSTHFEVCTISAIGAGTVTISATTQAYGYPVAVPLRVGTFAQPFTASRPSAPYNEAQALFNIIVTEDMVDESLDTYPDFAGYPLVTAPREKINAIEDSTTRIVESFDSKTGPIVNYEVLGYPTTALGISITAQTPLESAQLRSFLASLRGRWKAFWLSSQNADIQVATSIGVGYSAVPILPIGAATLFTFPVCFTIHTSALDYVAFRVTSVSAGTGGNENLDVDAVLTVSGGIATASSVFLAAVPLASIIKTSKLTLSRLDADRIEFKYGAGLSAKVAVPTQEVPVYP